MRLHAGPIINLTGVSMSRMLLYPPGSAWAFMPASFLPPSNITFIMSNCTISTLCATVTAYASFFNKTGEVAGVAGVR